MRGVQFQTHIREFGGVFLHPAGLLAHGARIGFLADNAVETDAVTAVFRDHVLPGLRGRNPRFEHLAGQYHLVQRLPDLAGMVQLQHHRRVGLVVVTLAVGTTPGQHIIIQGNLDSIHIIFRKLH